MYSGVYVERGLGSDWTGTVGDEVLSTYLR